MDIIAAIAVSAVVLALIIARIAAAIVRRFRADSFHRLHFAADRIYTVEEVSAVFRLTREQFHSFVGILEQFDHFRFFNRRGVTLVKDYYSAYELRALIRLVSRRNRLPS